MPIRYDRPVSHSAFLARRIAWASLVIFVASLAGHRFTPLTTPDLLTLLAISGALAAVSVPLALFGLARLWQAGALGGVAAARALLFAAPVLLLFGYGAVLYQTHPVLYDVASDTADPPRWIREPDAAQQWMPRPPITRQTRAAQLGAYPAVSGRRYEGALDRVYEAVGKVARQNRITVVASRGQEALQPEFQPQKEEGPPVQGPALPQVVPVPRPRPDPKVTASVPSEPPEPPGVIRVQGESRTLLIGLRFDLLVRLREEAETTLVDVRVASRYGPHDLGIGAAIAGDFLRALDVELLGIAGG